MDHLEPPLIYEFPPQVLYQVGIELDRYYTLGALKELLGECAAAWTDLYYQRLPLRTRRRGNALQYRTFDQKMLAELLTGQRKSRAAGF